MITDVAAGTPQSTYDGPIAIALKDTNDEVVIAALAAEGSLDEPGADEILLSFARRPDPLLRAGAIAALKGRTFFSAGSDRLIENGLRDPDIRVRAAAIAIIAPTTPTQLRLLQALADHAPTEAERRAAHERLDIARSSSKDLSK